MSGHSNYSINSRRIWFWKSPNLKESDSKEIPTYLIRNVYKNIVAITSKLFNIPSCGVTHCCWIKYSIRIPLWVMCVCVCVCMCVRACALVAQSCLSLCNPPGSKCPWNSPGKNTGVGCHSLLHRILLIPESNPHLLHFRQILCHLRHQGSPKIPLFSPQLNKKSYRDGFDITHYHGTHRSIIPNICKSVQCPFFKSCTVLYKKRANNRTFNNPDLESGRYMLSPDTTIGSFVTTYVASSASSSSLVLVKTKETMHVISRWHTASTENSSADYLIIIWFHKNVKQLACWHKLFVNLSRIEIQIQVFISVAIFMWQICLKLYCFTICKLTYFKPLLCHISNSTF